MKRIERIAAVVLVALLVPAAAPAAGPPEVQALKAENAALRAEIAACQAQVQALQAQVQLLTAQADQLRAELDRMRKQPPAPAPAAEPKLSATLDLRVEKGDWGDAGPRDIQKVLLSAGGELWKHFPGRKLAPILVRRSTSGPITLYDRGPGGEYIVKLDVEGTYWCQFAYQFAHEFCHILTNYTEKYSRKNKWFEESLAEAAAEYAVRQMGESWKTRPPYAHWKGFAAALTRYADNLRGKKSEELSSGQTLAQWYAANEGLLRKDPYQRDRNRLVAHALLALLEAEPARWQALGCLNLSAPDAGSTFGSYLAAWQTDTPAGHKPFAARVAGLFGIRLRSGE